MKRQKSLVQEVKEQVVTLLKQKYPEFKSFSFKTERWTTGGCVEVKWMDGPAEKKVAALLEPLKEGHSIHIGVERRYTDAFLRRVAAEYCIAKRVEVPAFEYLSDGSAWFDWRADRDLARMIVRECQKIDESDLVTLAYRDTDYYGIERAWVVRRKDYSYGKYPHLAICREKTYTAYERRLYRVRRRINSNWVEIVEMTDVRFMDNVFQLEEHVQFMRMLGRAEYLALDL